MFGSQFSTIETIAIAILPMVYAIVLHEIAHGWVARKLGDNTASQMGRLTLNPLKHIDPIGTIVVPIVLLLVAGFAFGWAKPVPVNFNNLHHPKRDMAWVAVAGPAANLLMAILWAIVLKLSTLLPESLGTVSYAIFYMALFGIMVNVILMVFNLIPLPPADGGRIATALLPDSAGKQLARLEPYGLVILVILLATGMVGKLMQPALQAVLGMVQLLISPS